MTERVGVLKCTDQGWAVEADGTSYRVLDISKADYRLLSGDGHKVRFTVMDVQDPVRGIPRAAATNLVPA